MAIELAGIADGKMKIFCDFLKRAGFMASKFVEAENTKAVWKTLRR
jgi:hypothetical protein